MEVLSGLRESPVTDELRSARLGVPVLFHIISPWVEEQFALQEGAYTKDSALLQRADLPELAAGLFEQNALLEHTLAGLGLPSEIRALHYWRIQEGQKAVIMMCGVEHPDDRVSYFVANVAAAADGCVDEAGHRLDQQLATDFRELRELETARQRLLIPEYRDQFRVIVPIALDRTGPIARLENRSFTVYTSPLISDQAEMHYDFFEKTGTPFFRHAYCFDTSFRQMSDGEIDAGPGSILRKMRALQALFPGIEATDEYLPALNTLVQDEMLRLGNGKDDVLRATALIFLLAGNRFPKEFLFNSGLFMGKFHGDGHMDLTVTSLRGGLSVPMSDRKWARLVADHTEPMLRLQLPNDPGRVYCGRLFHNGNAELFQQALKWVRYNLLIPGTAPRS